MDDISASDIAIYVAALANGLLVWRVFSGAPRWVEQWVALRRVRVEEKMADWNRRGDELRRLNDRCIYLEKAEKECRENYANLHGQHIELHREYSGLAKRVAELEGYMTGQGKASQEAAGVVALERMNRGKKPPEGK